MADKDAKNWFVRRRESLGLTQAQQAVACGVSDGSISQWERGVCFPKISPGSLDKIAGGYRVCVRNLVDAISAMKLK